MKRSLRLLTLGVCIVNLPVLAQRVALRYDRSLPQAAYAVRVLTEELVKQGYRVTDSSPAYTIDCRIDTSRLTPESYAVQQWGQAIRVDGGDGRGLIYGCLSLADELASGVTLNRVKPVGERPHLPFRAVKFNLPWDTYQHSQALDLHGETCRSPRFWEAFLDMMVANRFNALTLWNLHPFSFMIKPKNFPEANAFSDQEMADWRTLHQTIFRLAKERGIDTYLVNWNIFVSPAFAKAHHVTTDNIGHAIKATGDTSTLVKLYTREVVTQVLDEYPDLTGLGFTHGEAMGDMTPQERQDWLDETILEGMRLSKRKAKLIFRIPLSANLGMGGSTNVETEQLTRKALETQTFPAGPIWAEIKFNWSHAYSSTKLLKVHGGKLTDSYFNPSPMNYRISWMVRNEDFFCLRWGVPSFIREHIQLNSPAYVGGYFVGSECYIPANDYFTKPNPAINWTYAFERQWLFYKLWGRLLYNPSTPDDVFKAEFVRRYGPASAGLLEAHALVGTVPLRVASSFDFTWDFTLYSEGMMALDASKTVSYISVDRQINQSTADPTYISVKEYVQAQLTKTHLASDRVNPLQLAQLVEQDCRKAIRLATSINAKTKGPILYEVADIQTWANLGLHFAEKLRAAVALHAYRQTGEEWNKQAAIRHLEAALRHWDAVIAITRPLYADMPLVHYSEKDDTQRFHWEKLRFAVADDVDVAKQAIVQAGK